MLLVRAMVRWYLLVHVWLQEIDRDVSAMVHQQAVAIEAQLALRSAVQILAVEDTAMMNLQWTTTKRTTRVSGDDRCMGT